MSESETIYMLDIRGTCVDLSSEEAETVKASNEKYEKVRIIMISQLLM